MIQEKLLLRVMNIHCHDNFDFGNLLDIDKVYRFIQWGDIEKKIVWN